MNIKELKELSKLNTRFLFLNYQKDKIIYCTSRCVGIMIIDINNLVNITLIRKMNIINNINYKIL